MKIRMGELTAAETRRIFLVRPIILLPLGSHEDQGPHAPMGDYLSAERMAELIAERATEQGTRTLVAPVLPFGGADFFGTTPGGIALSQSTLSAVLDDIFSSLLRHGQTRLIVINGHGGNMQAIHFSTQAIWRTEKILIPSFYLWKIAKTLLPGIVGADIAARSTGHGADPLTSVATHLFPALMRPDLIPSLHDAPDIMGMKVSNFGSASFEGVDIEVPLELSHITPDGVFGADPRLCSAETGAKLVTALADLGARFVRHYAAQTG